VICVSAYTASEARILLDVPSEKITVIPNGVDPAYRSEVAPAEWMRCCRKHRLPRGALLYVGSEEKRKNLVNLAMAYMGLSRRRPLIPPLVLVGPARIGRSEARPWDRRSAPRATWRRRRSAR
jgi:hypothetical protein